MQGLPTKKATTSPIAPLSLNKQQKVLGQVAQKLIHAARFTCADVHHWCTAAQLKAPEACIQIQVASLNRVCGIILPAVHKPDDFELRDAWVEFTSATLFCTLAKPTRTLTSPTNQNPRRLSTEMCGNTSIHLSGRTHCTVFMQQTQQHSRPLCSRILTT